MLDLLHEGESDADRMSSIFIKTDKGEQVTYEEASQFELPLKRTLIFILCQSKVEPVLAYMACLRQEIVCLLIKDKMEESFLNHLIETYHPTHLWIPIDKQNGRQGLFSYGDYVLVKVYENTYPLHPDLALLLTTSGSTGSPKLVRQTYANIHANAISIATYLGLTNIEKAITTLPMHYTYGLSIINSHALVKGMILMTERAIVEKDFWRFLNEERATSIAGVPFTYEMLEKMKIQDQALTSIKTMTQAGGKLSRRLHEIFAKYALRHGKKFVVMYGATEATARMSYLAPEKALEKCGSIGQAIPGGRFSLIDEKDQVIEEADTVGELVYEGPNVTMGYAICGQDLAKEDMFKGIYATGDMAKRDEEGFYYIVGRKKRFIKIYGNRVSLDECEDLIRSKFLVECACLGVDEKMKIYITRKECLANAVCWDGLEIRSYIGQMTGLNPKAFEVILIEEIPKNSSGKIDYTRLSHV